MRGALPRVAQLRPVQRGRLLAGFLVGTGRPFAEHAGCDRQRGVNERDLNVAVPFGAALDERQGGEDPFGVSEVLSRGLGGCGVLCMGRAPSRSRPRSRCWRTSRGRLSVGWCLGITCDTRHVHPSRELGSAGFGEDVQPSLVGW